MFLSRYFVNRQRLFLAALAVAASGVIFGALSVRSARAAAPQTYVVQVGTASVGNIDLLQFAPSSLKVHTGDSITWSINGFHNVHIGAKGPADFVIAPPVNGQPLPQINPKVALPFGIKSGEDFKGDEAASGLPGPQTPPVFSVKVAMPEGSAFAFFCDVHPGMAGNISVVNNDEDIPTPAEVSLQASTEFNTSSAAALAAEGKLEEDSYQLVNSTQGNTTVQMGNDLGRAAGDLYFPNTTVIKVGESVTWKFAKNAMEPHTVSFPAVRGQEVNVMPQDGKPPIFALGPSLTPQTQNNATLKLGDKFSSGLLVPIPGKLPTFTLKFSDPGVYLYTCNIHPGMNGAVVVLPK